MLYAISHAQHTFPRTTPISPSTSWDILTTFPLPIPPNEHILESLNEMYRRSIQQVPLTHGDAQVLDQDFLGGWRIKAVDCVAGLLGGDLQGWFERGTQLVAGF